MPDGSVARTERTAEMAVRRPEKTEAGVVLTRAGIEAFLSECRSVGCSAGTLERYRTGMERIYEMLPEDKCVKAGSMAELRDGLLAKGYSPNTVNLILSVCSTWLDFIGHQQLQMTERVELEKKYYPELTRNEYLRLLQTAKDQGDERKYLLTKLFALTGISAKDLVSVTVETVQSGEFQLPGFFVSELLAYAGRQRITEGPIFLTRDGAPLTRTYVPSVLQSRSRESGVAQEKINPKCLRRLCEAARASIEANLALLVEQYMDRQMEQEEALYGWNR